MTFSSPFFKSQSSLLKHKQESLNHDAALTEQERIEYVKQAKESGELKQAEQSLENFERRQKINKDEMQRRELEVRRLDKQAHAVRKKMEESMHPAESADLGEIKKDKQDIATFSIELDRLDRQKRQHSAEIERLNEQNNHLDRQIDTIKVPR